MVFARTCSKIVLPTPVFYVHRVVFARTCPKFVLPIPLFCPSNGWFSPELARTRGIKARLASEEDDLRVALTCIPRLRRRARGASQPRTRVLVEPAVHAVRECLRAASGFVFPEITAAIVCEMILWSGEENGALECARRPLPGRLTRPPRFAGGPRQGPPQSRIFKEQMIRVIIHKYRFMSRGGGNFSCRRCSRPSGSTQVALPQAFPSPAKSKMAERKTAGMVSVATGGARMSAGKTPQRLCPQ